MWNTIKTNFWMFFALLMCIFCGIAAYGSIEFERIEYLLMCNFWVIVFVYESMEKRWSIIEQEKANDESDN